jgi:chain length determinant protein EpsF
MNLQQLLIVLRARYKAVLLVAVGTIAILLPAISLLPRRYTATSAVLVDVRSPDPVATLIFPASLATQVEIIQSERVAQRVVTSLGLVDKPGVRDQWAMETGGRGTPESWLARLLLRGLAVAPSRDSNIVQISFTHSDPDFTAAIANGFAQSYIDTTIELKVEPARQYARWFETQGKTLRDNLETAQGKLSAFQREKGIIAREGQIDIEMSKFSDLTAQLIKAQAEVNDARSKQKSGGVTLPEVSADAVVSGLRAEIGRKEATLQETALNLGSNHPQYLRMQSEVTALKQQLETEMRRVTGSFTATRTVGSDREGELRAAVEAQKNKLLMLSSVRDQLAVLQRDVDAAKSAYDAVSKRYTEASLASQATQANVSILNPALSPLEPSSPKSPDKMLALAIALGIALGIGTAFLLELLDRRIRSASDLAEALPFPVLGVIAPAREPRRLLFWRRRLALPAR